MKKPKIVRKALACKSCKVVFYRPVKKSAGGLYKGKTRCPSCMESLLRQDCINSYEQLKTERCLPSMAASKTKIKRQRDVAKLMSEFSSGIKADQVPNSMSECEFKLRANQKGWIVHRPSWPDFLVEDKDGKIFGVEVKSDKDYLSKYQRMTFDILEKAKLPIYVWKNTNALSDRLNRWRNTNA